MTKENQATEAPLEDGLSASESNALTVCPSDFPIVGIGASAGGLEALERLFQNMRRDSGMAFVVVQHLSPDFDSLMDQLLQRQTELSIKTVVDGTQVEPNTIYLMPAKTEMIISGGKLLLSEKDPHQGVSFPIDTFFRSLAQDAGSRSIGIVLSGTGSDGSRGIRDINHAGGLVVVQSEETAKFDGMPRSAVATGVVDSVLAPEEISDALLRYTKHPMIGERVADADSTHVDEDGINHLLRLLRDAYGIDFSLYQPATVMRRIQRRVLMNRSVDFEQYVKEVASDPNELNALYRDLLVGVTQFFRDSEAFEVIENLVIPDILERVPADKEIRVWVAACATGEEAYSLAILLHEQLSKANRPINVKIFATDVHQQSLDFAALGVYPENALKDVTPERRAKYFSDKGDQYQVSSELRQMVVFARHNIIKNAPFTRLDLVSCRNLLIYLKPAAQKKAISLFHFGLKTGGTLFLGPSEGVAELADELTVVDRHWKVFRKRRDVRLPADFRLPLSPASDRLTTGSTVSSSLTGSGDDEVATYVQLVSRFVPPSVLVNHRREIQHVFNRAGEFLRMHDGRASYDVLDHCDPDLKTAVAGALQRAAKERKAVSYAGVNVDLGGQRCPIQLGVTPLVDRSSELRHFLITFEPIQSASDVNECEINLETIETDDLSRSRIMALESDLDRTRDNLQATIEELETSNEELQATNEELVASNEELQSTNEELHSVNEELYTVNAEYQRKITELSQLNEDMDNLLASTEVGVIFLDDDLHIRKFTPHISRLFNIVNADIGRSFDNFTHNIEHDDLIKDVRCVQTSGAPIEHEVRDRFGHWHLLRIIPYRSQRDSNGVVVTLIDVQGLKTTQEELRRKDREQRAILDHSPAFIFIKDLSGKYTIASGCAASHLNVQPDEIIGRTDCELLPQAAADRMGAQDRAVATTGETSEIELQFDLAGRQHSVLSTKYALRDEGGSIIAVAGMWTDILRRTLAEQRAQAALVHRDRFLATLSHELRNPVAAMHSAAELIQRSSGDEATVRRAADVLSRQLGQTKRLLDDLLDLTRITRGDIELRKEVVDLRDVMNDAVLATRSIVTAHGLELNVLPSDEPHPVYGDPSRLQQVLVNLLVNAAKYTPSGGEVQISITRKQNRSVVEVRDSGVGMTPEFLACVFDPFVQADDTLDRSEGGMGLGLTLVKSLAELHDGKVTAASEGVGQGSVFTVSLPITRRTPQPKHRDDVSNVANRVDTSLRLLIVEDNADAREMLRMLLESEGYRVATTGDGISALAAIAVERPDVALIDIGLPELDGFGVAQRVRAQFGPEEVRLIALTGYGQASDREKTRAAGFDEHLTKPVDIRKLRETLAKITTQAESS